MWSQDLSSHQWKERIIVIHSNEPNANLADLQLNFLMAEKQKLAERKMVMYKCVSGQCEFYSGLNQKIFFKIKDTGSDFSTVLIGLDGGEKYRSKKVVKPKVFFDLIDAMPMRRQEMRGKEKEDD